MPGDMTCAPPPGTAPHRGAGAVSAREVIAVAIADWKDNQCDTWLPDHILSALAAAGIGTFDTRTHAAVSREMPDKAMSAGQQYINSVAFNGEHRLPAQFRWVDFWNRLLAAAEAEAQGGSDAG